MLCAVCLCITGCVFCSCYNPGWNYALNWILQRELLCVCPIRKRVCFVIVLAKHCIALHNVYRCLGNYEKWRPWLFAWCLFSDERRMRANSFNWTSCKIVLVHVCYFFTRICSCLQKYPSSPPSTSLFNFVSHDDRVFWTNFDDYYWLQTHFFLTNMKACPCVSCKYLLMIVFE